MSLKNDYKDDIYSGNRKYIQTTNEDGTISFSDATSYDQQGDYFGANELNAIAKGVNSTAIYQKAGGTATAVALTEVTLEDGYQKTFIVTTGNSGVSTTINGKPLYKPGGTTAPTLTAGKAVTVWYDLAGDCFFIKASAEGNSVAENVLAGKTFSNDNDTGLTGTMLNHTTDTEVTTAIVSNPDIYLTPPKGYWNGSAAIYKKEPNLKTDNIKAGTSILGITGKSTVVDTADAVLDPAYLVQGYFGYDDGVRKAGTMTNRSTENNHQPTLAETVSNANGYGAYVIPPAGYYNGSSWVRSLQPDLLSGNILSGKSIFGVAGNVVAGKRWASGAKTADGTATMYTHEWDGSTTGQLGKTRYGCYWIQVTGLNFTPSFIILTYNNNTALVKPDMPYAYYADSLGKKVQINDVPNSDLFYVSAGAFKVPALLVYNLSGVITWIAYE